MRLGIVAPYADPARGGHETFLFRLMSGLLERNVEITLFSRDLESVRRSLPSVEPVRVPTVSIPQALRYLSFNYFARRTVQNHDAPLDLLFTTGFVTFGDCYRAGGGLHRTFMEHRGPRWLPKPADWAKNHLQDRLFSRDGPRKYVVNSQMVRQELTHAYPHLSDEVVTVYNGVDTKKYHPEGGRVEGIEIEETVNLAPDMNRLLFVGREPRRKGLDLLLDALGRVDAEFQLIIAGLSRSMVEPYLSPDLKTMIDSGHVIILEFAESMPDLYRVADLTVLPTRYDPASNVVPESLASGTPVVTTTKNGAKEFITDGNNGKIHPSDDVDALVGILEEALLRSPAYLGWKPNPEFVSFLSVDRMVDELLAEFTEVASSQTGQPTDE